ncbi:lysoplasmalogenase [Reinekea blandensis]|uniref:YhhN-like protein n=1 Tax=Reinekea blandensis MED297 TaxID=314283 RepID=A4BI07_9GAMM|nr:lysoplasmalogenase [Reinekea blandensis]EAR08279.1 YhhN-like protein [Reinekea sp. MED297] [Reinekea blandensis MED297]
MTRAYHLTFTITALLYLILLPWPLPFDALLKILPIAVLALAVLRQATVQYRPLVLLALVFSASGDVLLEFDWFVAGVAAFLIAQVGYAVLFFNYRKSWTNRWPASLALVVYIALMAWVLLPNLGEMTAPVVAYLTVISAMGLLALQSRLSLFPAVIGALVFISSDSMIAIDRFLAPLPLRSYWIMITYYGAQWLLILGFLSVRTDR